MKTVKMYTLSDLAKVLPMLTDEEQLSLMGCSDSSSMIYSIVDFVNMLEIGTWKGGVVAGLGYISAKMFKKVDSGCSDILMYVPTSSACFDIPEDEPLIIPSEYLSSNSSTPLPSVIDVTSIECDPVSDLVINSPYCLIGLEVKIVKLGNSVHVAYKTKKNKDYFIKGNLYFYTCFLMPDGREDYRVSGMLNKYTNFELNSVEFSSTFYLANENMNYSLCLKVSDVPEYDPNYELFKINL